MNKEPKKPHKCINGFTDDEGRLYFYGELITTEELDSLTSNQQRNFKTENPVFELIK